MPALAVADALSARGADVSFIGARGRAEERLVPAAGYPIDLVTVSGLSRTNPLRAARAVWQALAAVPAARRILKERQADAVMGGGGYVAWPAGVAAVFGRRPLVLTEADRRLGLANRLLARRAKRVCLAFPLPGHEGDRYLVTGRPVGEAVRSADRGAARRRFGLDGDARCVLVFGGSQGARSINMAAVEAFAAGGSARGFHVIHISGSRDHAEVAARLAAAEGEAENRGAYTLLEYEPDLGDTLAACDLVVARSGGSVFEIAALARPSVLVPYPHATDDHQTTNAEWMAEAGAAKVIADADLDAEMLRATVERLLGDPARLRVMSEAAASLARPEAADDVAEAILAEVGER